MLGPVSIPSKSLEAWIINGLVPISRNGNFKFYSVRGKNHFFIYSYLYNISLYTLHFVSLSIQIIASLPFVLIPLMGFRTSALGITSLKGLWVLSLTK